MRFDFEDRFIDVGVPEAGSAADSCGGSGVAVGGLNLHEVKHRSEFCYVSFVDCLVSFKQGDLFGIFGDVGSKFEVFAVLSFNDLLNVVDKSFGRFSSLCLTDFGKVTEDLILGGFDCCHEIGGNVLWDAGGVVDGGMSMLISFEASKADF